MENLSFHQAESFITQNSKDWVHMHDFMVFCQQTNHHLDLGPQPVSNVADDFGYGCLDKGKKVSERR